MAIYHHAMTNGQICLQGCLQAKLLWGQHSFIGCHVLIAIKGGAYEENGIHFDVVGCLFAGIDRLSSGGDR
ncbi:MAG: hypothetical protein P8X54_04040 [Desulfuromonadales bacterium]